MKTKVLFVCLGNICRSPMAEAIFTKLVQERGLEGVLSCDSAGTNGFHNGERADSRMRRCGARKDYELTSISRQIDPETDFDEFDLILGMDTYNVEDIRSLTRNKTESDKVMNITDFCSDRDCRSVPDPYYGGEQGFELVIDILEDACTNLLNELR